MTIRSRQLCCEVQFRNNEYLLEETLDKLLEYDSLRYIIKLIGVKTAESGKGAAMANAFSYTNKKDQTYYLHTREVTLKNGRKQTIFFFARDVREKMALTAVPEGYEVVETTRTGMPVLKRSK